MTGWWLVPLAFASMFFQDILATVLVQAESDGRAHLAASMDTAGDVCALASLGAVGGSVLSGNDWLLAACVISARLGADYSGTYTGVKVGNRIRAKVRRPA